MRIYLSCPLGKYIACLGRKITESYRRRRFSRPECRKESRVEITVGFKSVPKAWYYDCQFCSFKKHRDFSFFERLLSSFLLPFPTVLYLTAISRFSDSPYKIFIVIAGLIASIVLGILASKFYLKLRVKKFCST